MLIAVRDVQVGDVLGLPGPSARSVRVEAVDVYREPRVPGEDGVLEKFVVRWRAAGAQGSLAVALGDEFVSLRSRRGTPVGRW